MNVNKTIFSGEVTERRDEEDREYSTLIKFICNAVESDRAINLPCT